MIDLLPPGPTADAITRAMMLAMGDRQQHWDALRLELMEETGPAIADETLAAALPVGREAELDDEQSRAVIRARARQILAGVSSHVPNILQ